MQRGDQNLFLQEVPSPTADTSDELDLHDFCRAIFRRWRTIAVFTAIATLIALRSILFATPQFTVNGTFYLGDGQTVVNTAQANFLSDYQVVSSVNAQLQLIQSQALLKQAVLETGLNASIAPVGQEPLPYWKWRLFYHKSPEAFAPGPNDLVAQFAMFGDPAAGGASFRLEFDGDGHYRLMTPGGFFAKPRLFLAGTLGQAASAGGISLVIKSATGSTPPPAGSVYNLTIVPAKAMVEQIASLLTVGAAGPAVAPTNVALVRFVWHDPYQATNFVTQLMHDFIQSQLAWKTESASNTQNYIAGQLEKISAALARADQTQASYQSQTGIVDVPANSQAVIAQLSAYQSQRSTLLLQQQALQQLVTAVSKKNAGINPYLISQVNDPVLANLATTLANAEVKLESQQTEFRGDSPEIRQQRATIDRIEKAIGTLLQNDEEIASKNLANIDSMIAQYQKTLQSMPAEALHVGELSRSSQVLGTLYALLMQKEEEAEVSKAATIENTRIISSPEIPLYASSPKVGITLLAGILLGLMAGLGVVLAQRAFSGRFHNEMEIRQAVSLPVYGVIPKRTRNDSEFGEASKSRVSPFAEAFRFLRRNLYDAPSEHKSRVVLITSASVGDGKTTIATNIAKTLADDGKRVLLIDADLHCGRLKDTLNLPAGPGLSDCLVTQSRPWILPVEAQSFKVLLAGSLPRNPAELLNLPWVADVFKALRDEFDFILLDSPPLPVVSDALALAAQADLVLSVVTIEHTQRRDFAAHCEIIGGMDSRHGMLINGVDRGPYGGGAESGDRGGYLRWLPGLMKHPAAWSIKSRSFFSVSYWVRK